MMIAQDGEELIFPKISRTDSGAYLCIASNGVPPSVSKRIILDVECKSFDYLSCCFFDRPGFFSAASALNYNTRATMVLAKTSIIGE